MSILIDFSRLPSDYDPRFGSFAMLLRRTDLAQLRQCVRAGAQGVGDKDCIDKTARSRLVAHGMLVRSLGPDNAPRTCPTEFGIAVVQANSSCMDGTEGRQPPARAKP